MSKVIPADDKYKNISIKLPPILLSAIDNWAVNHHMTRSEAIRYMLTKFLEREYGYEQ